LSGKGKISYVFTSSYSDRGFYTFIPGLLEGLKKVYVLKGAPGSGKSTLIRSLGDEMSERGYEVDFWMSAEDSMNPEGLYIIQLECAVVNGNLPVAIDPRYPGLTGSIVNLSEYLDEMSISPWGAEIVELVDQVLVQSRAAEELLHQASAVREQMIQAGCQQMDENRVNLLLDRLEKEILQQQPGGRHYFGTSLTADGIVNYVDEISSRCKIRYLLKGSAGAGRIIDEMAVRAKKSGYSVEYYHCGINPSRVIMLIVSHLQLAIIDAGDAELSIRPGDRLVDMTDCMGEPAAPDQAQEQTVFQRHYEGLLMQAQGELEGAHKARRNLKRLYSSALNFELLEQKRQELFQAIVACAKDNS